jgi:hypothetical protein
MANTVFAQITPKPSVPQFSVKLVTSETENKSTIQFTIENQHYEKTSTQVLFYNIRYRANNSNWKEVYRPDDGYPSQSNSEYTILSFPLSDEYQDYFVDTTTNPPWSFSINTSGNSVLVVQAQALIGYVHRVPNPNATNQLDMYPYVFTGEKSDWSNTETITISDNSSPALTSESLQNNSQSTPTIISGDQTGVFGLSWEQLLIASLVLVIIVLSIIVLRMNRKRK